MKRIHRKAKKRIYRRTKPLPFVVETGLTAAEVAKRLNLGEAAVYQEQRNHGFEGIRRRLAMCDSH